MERTRDQLFPPWQQPCVLQAGCLVSWKQPEWAFLWLASLAAPESRTPILDAARWARDLQTRLANIHGWGYLLYSMVCALRDSAQLQRQPTNKAQRLLCSHMSRWHTFIQHLNEPPISILGTLWSSFSAHRRGSTSIVTKVVRELRPPRRTNEGANLERIANPVDCTEATGSGLENARWRTATSSRARAAPTQRENCGHTELSLAPIPASHIRFQRCRCLHGMPCVR